MRMESPRVAELIYQISSILFLVVGIVTNLFSAIIYSKKKMRKTSYAVYLFALALADLLVTINGNTRTLLMSFPDVLMVAATYEQQQHQHQPLEQPLSRSQPTKINQTTQEILKHEHEHHTRLRHHHYQQRYAGFDIRETSIVVCRMQRFFTYYSLQLSSCLLCLLSIDRFFGIVLALKAFQLNRSSIARKIVVILVCLIAFFNAHFLIFMGYNVTTTSTILHVLVNKVLHANK